jgi:hypothetical protein
MAKATKAIEGEAPSETARTMAPLLRAAVADYRRRVREDFTTDRGMGLVATGDPETGAEKHRALSSIEAILHRLVLAVHGGGRSSCASGVMAVEVDGTLVLVDSEDDLDEGERIHVIEWAEVITFA